MRLSSFARKLGIKPSELKHNLEENGHDVSAGSNMKLNDEQIELLSSVFGKPEEEPEVIQKTTQSSEDLSVTESTRKQPIVEESPTEVVEEEETEIEKKDESTKVVISIPDQVAPSLDSAKSVEENAEETAIEDTPDSLIESEDTIEVIKAPKITLPGLTVKGKIELPEPKPKPETPNEKEATAEKEKPKRNSDRKSKSGKQRRKKRNDDYNPIEAARKREAKRLEREKAAKAKQEKEEKRRRYEQQFGQKSQLAKQRQKDHKKSKEVSHQRQVVKQKQADLQGGNIIQKFWRWLNTY